MSGDTSSVPTRRKQGGFTLIELMIVVVIILILLSIVIPMLDRNGCQFARRAVSDAREYRACLNTPNCKLTGAEYAHMRKVEQTCPQAFGPSVPGSSTNMEVER